MARETFEVKFNPSQERKEKEIEAYYQYLRPVGEVFSQYGAYEIRIDPRADSHYFDYQRKEVVIAPKMIEELNLAKEEQKWAFFHELSHLIQLFQSPDQYLERFEIPKEKAREKGEAYKNAYNNFFNVFDDIHANSIIRKLMPIYQKGGVEEKVPEKLYKDKAFKSEDYTSLPLSQQFLYFLLKKRMAPEAPCKISEEVEKIIKFPLMYFGEKYNNLEEFVKEKIADPTKKYEDVFFYEKEFLLSIYEELLAEDAKNNRLNEIPAFLGEINLDEGLDEGTIRKIRQQIEESRKSPEEKYKDYVRKETKKKAREMGFSEAEIKRMEEIQEKTENVVSDLEDLWENFIQKSTKFTRVKKEGFKTGASISPEKVLSQLPVLLTDPSEAEIFYRYVGETEKEEIKPKKIGVSLLLDLSGSMDAPKRKAVQEVGYSLVKSLINFYRNGKLAMAGREFPISIYYRLIGFGEDIKELTEPTAEEITQRRKIDTPQRNLDKELWQAILKIGRRNLLKESDTRDAPALKEIEKEFKRDTRIETSLKENEEIWIVLEITDGETSTVSESKRIVKELNEKPNIYCRAIQIPGPVYSEKPKPTKAEKMRPPEVLPPTGTFKEVWEEKGRKLKSLNTLKETVTAIFYDALRERIYA